MSSRDTAGDTGGATRRATRHHAPATTRGDTDATEFDSRCVAACRGETPADLITNANYRLSGMSAEQIRALPAAVPFDPIVPAAFGISRSAAYRALAAGQLPIAPLRLGRRLIVRRSDLLTALGLSDETSNNQNEPPSGNPNHWKDGQ